VPIVMMIRLPRDGIGEGGGPIWKVVASISLLMYYFYQVIVRWLAKIYRVGILMYE